MGTLKEYSNMQGAGVIGDRAGKSKSHGVHDMVGVALHVSRIDITTTPEGEQMEVIGKVTNTTPLVAEGEEIRVQFRGKPGAALENLYKGTGQGKAVVDILKSKPETLAGTLLALEGCYKLKADNGEPIKDAGNLQVFSSRWLTTISSNLKLGHANRQLLSGVYVSPPQVSFSNPRFGRPEEPKHITIPVNAEHVWVQVPTADGMGVSTKMPKEWAVERLKEAKDPQVSVETYSSSPDDAKEIKSEADLRKVLTEQLAAGTTSAALIRISDEDSVYSRKVFCSWKKDGDNYVPDIETTLNKLFAGQIFKEKEIRNVPNEVIFERVQAGTIKMESVSGYRLSFSGKADTNDNVSFKIVNQLMEGKVSNFQAIWGNDPANFAKVLLPGIARTGDLSGFSPINYLAEEVGTWTVKTLPTPLLDTQHAPELPVKPEEDEPAMLPQADIVQSAPDPEPESLDEDDGYTPARP